MGSNRLDFSAKMIIFIIGGIFIIIMFTTAEYKEKNRHDKEATLLITQNLGNYKELVAYSDDSFSHLLRDKSMIRHFVIYETKSGNLRVAFFDQSHPPKVIMISQEFKENDELRQLPVKASP
ncbi:MAG: hypothetical protein NTX00_00280 [Candidatus Parcubacteria bacterium]|nr:hypothetical protein [Candidatus Parcubacteria bacterium]